MSEKKTIVTGNGQVWQVSVTKKIRLDEIDWTGGTQFRVKLNDQKIQMWIDNKNKSFPPLTVFSEDGEKGPYIGADGRHRSMALADQGVATFEVDIIKGTKTDAIKFALGANNEHGIPRTRADIHKAVSYALNNPEIVGKSNRKIADLIGVCHTYINNIMKSEELQERLGVDVQETKKKRDKMKMDQHLSIEKGGEEGGYPIDHANLPLDEATARIWTVTELEDLVLTKFRELTQAIDRLGSHPGAHALTWQTGSGDNLREAVLVETGGETKKYKLPRLQELQRELKARFVFAAICPYCVEAGKVKSTCQHCHGTNCVDRFTWEQSPPELREAAAQEAQKRLG